MRTHVRPVDARSKAETLPLNRRRGPPARATVDLIFSVQAVEISAQSFYARELWDQSFHAWTSVANLKAPKPEELDMSSTQARSESAIETPRARTVDMKLEVVVIPVSDVGRAKRFYGGLGWRLDADYASDDGYFGVIQFTPPGSGCSVIFGKNVTAATPGSAQGL